jgi:hypothetical protein
MRAWQLRKSKRCGFGEDDWCYGERQSQRSGPLDLPFLLDQVDPVATVTGLDMGTQLVVMRLGGCRDTHREHGHKKAEQGTRCRRFARQTHGDMVTARARRRKEVVMLLELTSKGWRVRHIHWSSRIRHHLLCKQVKSPLQ